MNRKILNLLFISFISVCLVMGLTGRIAKAATGDEPSRSGQAYEQERTCVGGVCYYTGRQYTSQYDLMRGQIFPEITVQYMTPNYGWMMNPIFGPSSEYSYDASATGGLFTGPMMQFPVSPMSYMLGTYGAPRANIYQSQGLFSGNMSYMNMYQGFGFPGAGFMLGPFSQLFSGYNYGSPSLGTRIY